MSTESFWFAFLLPMAVCLAICFTIYLRICRAIFKRRQTSTSDEKQALVTSAKNLLTAVSLAFLLGFSWLVGLLLLASDSLVLQYIYVLLQMLTGLSIIVFHVIMRKDIIDLLRRKFGQKVQLPPKSGSTTGSRSDIAGSRMTLASVLERSSTPSNMFLSTNAKKGSRRPSEISCRSGSSAFLSVNDASLQRCNPDQPETRAVGDEK